MGVIGIALPLAAFAVTWAALLGNASIRGEGSIRGSFLRAAVLWGTFVAVSAEVLSWFDAIRQGALVVLWALALGILTASAWRRRLLRAAWMHLRCVRPDLTTGDRVIAIGIAVVALLLLVTAWVSPPNNYDSLLYHMARVVHWAQAGSLDHFPSGFEHQLTKPTWAETAILHLRVLWGDDRPSNLVQWFSMLGSLIGVSAIAGLVGAGRRGQLLAAAIALSIPMGLLQATSTQNDYVVAFWAVCLAYLVVSHKVGRASPWDVLFVGLSTGLGLLTKGTGYVYSLPFVVWFFWPRQPWPRMSWVRDLGAVAVLVVLLNLGFWGRNVLTFGGPFGTSEWLSGNLTLGPVLIAPQAVGAEEAPPEPTQAMPSDSANGDETSVGQPGALSRLGGLAKTALGIPQRVAQVTAFQLVPPFGKAKRVLRESLELFPGVFDIPALETIRMSWNHEDLAPSPLHMLLAILTCGGVWFLRPRSRWSGLRGYTLALIFCFLLLPVVIGHVASIWGIRYVLPFFVLAAPVGASVIAQVVSHRLLSVVTWCFIGLSLPWTLLNDTRPLIGYQPKMTRIESVLVADPSEVLLANNQRGQDDYWGAATEVRARGCTSVGLYLTTVDTPEYIFWRILDAPQSGIRIESLYYSEHTAKYVDPGFEPCLIICEACEAVEKLSGYHPVARYGTLVVLEPDATGD